MRRGERRQFQLCIGNLSNCPTETADGCVSRSNTELVLGDFLLSRFDRQSILSVPVLLSSS